MSTPNGDDAPPAALAGGSSAEAQTAAFANDPRVHFDRAAGTWRFEQDDGSELEYDAAKGAWLPVVRSRLAARILARGLTVFPSVLLRCAMGHAWMYSSTRTF